MPRIAPIDDWRWLLSRFERVGIRGPITEAKLRGVGVNEAEVIGDLAMSLAQDHAYPRATDPPSVGVNISFPPAELLGQGEYASVAGVGPALDRLVHAGWRVVPFAMTALDIEAIEQLRRYVKEPFDPITVISTMEEFRAALGPCTLTIAVRLHAAVLSVCCGVPPLMLGYRDKCEDFMESVGLGEWYVDLALARTGYIERAALLLASEAPTMRARVLSAAQKYRSRLEAFAGAIRPEKDSTGVLSKCGPQTRYTSE